eukprot:SAG11_NODE_4300_length_1963_cov_2.149142_2_plen_91_part_00
MAGAEVARATSWSVRAVVPGRALHPLPGPGPRCRSTRESRVEPRPPAPPPLRAPRRRAPWGLALGQVHPKPGTVKFVLHLTLLLLKKVLY